MPASHRPGKTSFPDQRTLLTWLFGGRLLVALATLIAGALVWTRVPQASFLASIAVIVALLVTAYGAWMLRNEWWEPGPIFLATQFVVDLALITLLARFLGPTGGAAPALYVLLIAAYAVLVPIGFGVAMALAASSVFAVDVIQQSGSDAALWAQVVVFNLVFAVVAILGHRLRAAGLEAHTLETELERVRLEADVILRNIRSGVVTVDPHGRLAFMNPTAQQLLHLDGEAMIGEPVLDRLKLRSSELWAAMVAGIRHGRKVSRGEGLVVHDGGTQFHIGLSTTTFQQQPDAASSVTAIFTDISDSKQLQELQLRAERLEAVAALSASLAHEIRNPLASIRSSVEQLARGQHAGEDERTLAGLIVRESDRLSRLLSEFLDFSRVRATRAEPVDLHAVALAAVRLVEEHPDCTARARLVVEGEPTIVEGDEDLLHRTLVNLLLNAVQAAGEADVDVTVSLRPTRSGELPAGLQMERPIRLSVQDTGPGIPEEIRERMFEPFVSRRPGGTGLGLAIVQRAVAAHRGAVIVDSEPGAGTTFTIYLPATWVAEDVA
ncbi:MAG TPA: ATP-binding protein [Gemmatimonadales bacterium]|nr:ATP-binding protein [Gemmatimonadales bacterium]